MRRRLDRSIKLLVGANLVLVVVLAVALFFALIRTLPTAGHPTQDVNAAEPTSSASPSLMAMGLAHIPTSNACVLCHDSGGSAGLKVVPALGHPLEGWRQCLTCHTNPTLGRVAPGHVGISETQCLNCHKEAVPGPTITQPHSKLQDQHCLDCHGSVAHLPSSMASKKETTCTLCHKPTSLAPPQYPPAATVTSGCRECHKSPEVGNLPVDHAMRSDSSCLLCHDIKKAAASPSPKPPEG